MIAYLYKEICFLIFIIFTYMRILYSELKKIICETLDEKKSAKGLWHNIHKRRKAGKRPLRPGEEGYPKTLDIEENDKYEETLEETDDVVFELFEIDEEENNCLEEAEYQGRDITLNKPMRGDIKKFKVYTKNEKGNVVKVNFGDPNMRIRKSNPGARKSFRARHNCDEPGPKWKARYWSCRKW